MSKKPDGEKKQNNSNNGKERQPTQQPKKPESAPSKTTKSEKKQVEEKKTTYWYSKWWSGLKSRFGRGPKEAKAAAATRTKKPWSTYDYIMKHKGIQHAKLSRVVWYGLISLVFIPYGIMGLLLTTLAQIYDFGHIAILLIITYFLFAGSLASTWKIGNYMFKRLFEATDVYFIHARTFDGDIGDFFFYRMHRLTKKELPADYLEEKREWLKDGLSEEFGEKVVDKVIDDFTKGPDKISFWEGISNDYKWTVNDGQLVEEGIRVFFAMKAASLDDIKEPKLVSHSIGFGSKKLWQYDVNVIDLSPFQEVYIDPDTKEEQVCEYPLFGVRDTPYGGVQYIWGAVQEAIIKKLATLPSLNKLQLEYDRTMSELAEERKQRDKDRRSAFLKFARNDRDHIRDEGVPEDTQPREQQPAPQPKKLSPLRVAMLGSLAANILLAIMVLL